MTKALLVIDVQQGMFMLEQAFHETERFVTTVNQLIDEARVHNVPIIFVQHVEADGPLQKGSSGAQLYEGLHRLDGDVVVVKQTPDAFHETTLHDILQQLSIQQLIIAGLQTEYCVDTTCRRAFSLGYEVTLVSDGHSTWNNSALTAAQIIAHHNETLRAFADVRCAHELEW